jgi:hypothetical protein
MPCSIALKNRLQEFCVIDAIENFRFLAYRDRMRHPVAIIGIGAIPHLPFTRSATPKPFVDAAEARSVHKRFWSLRTLLQRAAPFHRNEPMRWTVLLWRVTSSMNAYLHDFV